MKSFAVLTVPAFLPKEWDALVGGLIQKHENQFSDQFPDQQIADLKDFTGRLTAKPPSLQFINCKHTATIFQR
jgi:hypothetical protein